MIIRIGTKFYKVLLVEIKADVVLQEIDMKEGRWLYDELSSVPFEFFHPIWQDKIAEFGRQMDAGLARFRERPVFDWMDEDIDWEDEV
jgi:hypothetical protein